LEAPPARSTLKSSALLEAEMATHRVALFVDGSNMFYAQRENKWHIDFRLVHQYVMDNREKAAAYYFTASPPAGDSERVDKYRGFKTALINMGYSVVDKEVKVLRDEATGTTKLKGNLDIDLVFKMLTSVNGYDEAILMGGDSDYVPIIDHLRNSGKIVTVISRRKSTATDLINAATKFVDLDSIKNRIEKRKAQK